MVMLSDELQYAIDQDFGRKSSAQHKPQSSHQNERTFHISAVLSAEAGYQTNKPVNTP